jgi:hypothetical protein
MKVTGTGMGGLYPYTYPAVAIPILNPDETVPHPRLGHRRDADAIDGHLPAVVVGHGHVWRH